MHDERLKARKLIQDFFEEKRKKLNIKKTFGFIPKTGKDAVLQKFLNEMNTIARDYEKKAMKYADLGKDYNSVLEEAKNALENLKRKWLRSLGKGDPFKEAINKEAIKVIEVL